MNALSLIPAALALVLSPLLPGFIGKVKACAAGRKGPPVMQVYRDLWKLLHKGAAVSKTTTWLFAAGPAVALAATFVASALLPLGPSPALVAFPGDLLLLAGLFALGRFATMLAALDTGSSFEGMGASREAWFAALAEVAFLLSLAALAHEAGSLSMTGIARNLAGASWWGSGAAAAIAAAALFIVLLCENARIPVDDPATHLELTMIHEVMVLDHGGPDLAFITYGQCVKLWCFAAIIAVALPPVSHDPFAAMAVRLAEIAAIAVAIGLVESTMARLKLLRVPQLLAGASALALVALALSFLVR